MLPFLKLCAKQDNQNWKCFPHFWGIYNWYYHIEYVPASSSSSQYLVKWYISNIMFFFFYHFLFRLSDNEIQILCEMICIKFMWDHMYEVLFEMTYIKYSVKWYIPSIISERKQKHFNLVYCYSEFRISPHQANNNMVNEIKIEQCIGFPNQNENSTRTRTSFSSWQPMSANLPRKDKG